MSVRSLGAIGGDLGKLWLSAKLSLFLLFKPIYFDFTRRSNVLPFKVLHDHVPPILSQYKSVLDDKFKAWAACGKHSRQLTK